MLQVARAAAVRIRSPIAPFGARHAAAQARARITLRGGPNSSRTGRLHDMRSAKIAGA
jgi:hypothetical protein